MFRQILLFTAGLTLAAPIWAAAKDSMADIDMMIRQRNYNLAAAELRALIAQDNPEAQYRMAGLYRSGKGVKRDLPKAQELYTAAAIAGHADAQYALGLLIEKSDKQRITKIEAYRWYRQAARQGHVKALQKMDTWADAPTDAGLDLTDAQVLDAIRHNEEELVTSLVGLGRNMDVVDEQNNSSLMVALLAGWPTLADLLIPVTTIYELPNLNGETPIHVAARRGYLKIVEDLLAAGANPDAPDGHGNTALMVAVRSNQPETVRFLLLNQADHRMLNQKKLSAVDMAYTLDDPGMGRIFSEFGIARPKKKIALPENTLESFAAAVRKEGTRYSGWPLLNVAIELDEKPVAKQLINTRDVNALDPAGNSALHRAAIKNNAEFVNLLLARGANINAVNKDKETPLYLAVVSGSQQSADALLRRGADPKITRDAKTSLLEIAVQGNQADIAMSLLQKEIRQPVIHRALKLAIQQKMGELSFNLIKRDTSLGTLDEKKRTVLWYSADLGQETISRILVKSEAIDIDQKDVNGYSALARAVQNGHVKTVRMLIDNGADLATRTDENNTLLMLAVLAKKPEIVELLLARGTEINAQDNVGDTALMLAAGTAQDAMIKMLIAAGADMQLRNREEQNAFQVAIDAGHKDSAEIIQQSSSVIFRIFN